jgi:CRISPR-associated DxTHG motif protein
LFTILIEELSRKTDDILLDITHGFRSQPFFAAACIQYVQSINPGHANIRVVYAEYKPQPAQSPIWELTTFLDVLAWSRDLMLMLRTGQAGGIVRSTDAINKSLMKRWRDGGRTGRQPRALGLLKRDLEAFSGDLTTIRTGSLLIGSSRGKHSSAEQLVETLDATRPEIAEHLPALLPVLDQLRAMAEPLQPRGHGLGSMQGQQALIALARLYRSMGRYSEAISVVREGWISYGGSDAAASPGWCAYRREERQAQETRWSSEVGKFRLTVQEVRNDIQHAGFQSQPKEPAWFNARLDALLERWQETVDAVPVTPSPGSTAPAYWMTRAPITNVQYRRAVTAGVCGQPAGRHAERLMDPQYAHHPVVQVTRADACAYASWVGGRLPTDAEWTWAAQGSDGRRWPWGNQRPDETRANCRPHGPGGTTPVGAYPQGVSPHHMVDMAGNVWEWVADGAYVVRGGAFYCDAATTGIAARLIYGADTSGYHIGFRVVWDRLDAERMDPHPAPDR